MQPGSAQDVVAWGWFCDGAVPEDFPSDAELIFAEYDHEDYDGRAVVVYERGGQLFEVHGSHCSCYGLEGQWSPEATTIEALLMRDPWAWYAAALVEALRTRGWLAG